jgi:flagellar hook-associated protein 3 FlgL
MRITFSDQHRLTSDGINRAAERLFEWQRQVGTGKRVQRASDDPSAAAAASVERGTLAAVDQYSETADSANARLTVTDTVLSDIIQQLTSAQVTVLSARGTTLTAQQREAKAQELTTLRDALLQDLNSSFRGTYLFAGAASTTRPYNKDNAGVVSAYQGSALEVAVDIDNGLEVTVGFNGEALARGSEIEDVFEVFDRAIAAARSGDVDELNTVAGDLDRAFERATAVQSRVGAALRAVGDGKLRLGESARASEALISALEDTNMAAAVTNMTQAETTYRAALAAAAQMHRLSLMDYLK